VRPRAAWVSRCSSFLFVAPRMYRSLVWIHCFFVAPRSSSLARQIPAERHWRKLILAERQWAIPSKRVARPTKTLSRAALQPDASNANPTAQVLRSSPDWNPSGQRTLATRKGCTNSLCKFSCAPDDGPGTLTAARTVWVKMREGECKYRTM
jgi:hypothetical protein